MFNKISAVVLGVVLCLLFAKNLNDRKTIILSSSRMKKLNNDIIKVDNKCYKMEKDVSKCAAEDE